MNTRHPYAHSRAGQAMIELMLGVILILILLVGTVQFVEVADAHTGIDARIRGRSGFLAMSPILLEDTPRYITTWQPGTDGQRFTADDQPVFGSPDAINRIASDTVNNPADWSVLSGLRQTSSLESLHQNPVPLMALGFIGIRQSATVPVSDIAQELFYDKSTVTVQEDCWMPIMNGLY